MRVDFIRRREDVEACIDLYMSMTESTFLEIHREYAIKGLDLAARRRQYIRVLKDGDEIVAFLVAFDLHSLHTKHRILNQSYYGSKLSGVKAFKAVMILHDDLFEYAVDNKYDLVMAQSSHEDPTFVYSRILEKLKWERRGHLAIKKTR